MEKIDLTRRFTKNNIQQFVEFMEKLDAQIGFKVSSRGWAYIMEQEGLVSKDQFDKIENLINRCRKAGYLPVDITAEESARGFKEVHTPDTETPQEFLHRWIEYGYRCEGFYEPEWWEGEEYYIQMVVEKIDLVTLFQPLCKKYHIPIANAKGWSSILQRAEYARRFKKAESNGLQCVLLYCGDHDPDGLRISHTLRKNIEDISDIRWGDGDGGYDPSNLTIDRFGLNHDFIKKNELTWIDNLVTGGGELARMQNGQIVRGTTKGGKPHPNWELPYLQNYLDSIGVRKCEANALVTAPEAGRELCEQAIMKYVGADALIRFEDKKAEARNRIMVIKNQFGIDALIDEILDMLSE